MVTLSLASSRRPQMVDDVGYPLNTPVTKTFTTVTTVDILLLAGPVTLLAVIVICVIAIATEGL